MLLKSLSSSGTRFVSRTNTQMLSGSDSTISLSRKRSLPVGNLAKEVTGICRKRFATLRNRSSPHWWQLIGLTKSTSGDWKLSVQDSASGGELEHTPEAIEAW